MSCIRSAGCISPEFDIISIMRHGMMNKSQVASLDIVANRFLRNCLTPVSLKLFELVRSVSVLLYLVYSRPSVQRSSKTDVETTAIAADLY